MFVTNTKYNFGVTKTPLTTCNMIVQCFIVTCENVAKGHTKKKNHFNYMSSNFDLVLIVPSIEQYSHGKNFDLFLSEILGTVDFVLTDGTVVFRTCEAEKQHVVFQMVCGLQFRLLTLHLY